MNRLRNMRKSKMLTQKELARLAGVHRVSIARYEEGKISPNIATAAKLAAALNCTVDELVGKEDEPT